MDDDELDPLDSAETTPIVPSVSLTKPYEVPGQGEYLKLIDQCQVLFRELPRVTTRDVDKRLEKIFETVMNLAPYVGVSRMSIPLLRDCCGGKRVWTEDLGWGLGDIIRRITRLFGFGHCDGCERRRTWLNSLFRRKR